VSAVPYPGTRELVGPARRAAALRLLLAGGLIAAVVATAFSVRSSTVNPPSFLPTDRAGIVVLDVSSSITVDKYTRIHNTLLQLAASHARYGLVIFSATAYEALPPGSAASAFRPLARLFAPPKGSARHLSAPRPWGFFTSVTEISSGLELARVLIGKYRVRRPAVLLISDLQDDPQDLKPLVKILVGYRNARIPLKVIALGPSPKDLALFQGVFRAPVTTAPLRLDESSSAGVRSTPRIPGRPMAAIVLFAILLMRNELRSARLDWRNDRSTA
jgi:hypothetical protein